MAQYRKKPVVIEAFQWWGEDVPGFEAKGDGHGHWWLLIPTLEGVMEASEGDWIITGVNGERYPCKPDIFAKSYEAV